MANRKKHRRIILENPPAPSKRGPKKTGTQEFLRRLAEQHPNEWAVFDRRTRSGHTYLSSLRKKSEWKDRLEVTSRGNDDGTRAVWVRIKDAPTSDES